MANSLIFQFIVKQQKVIKPCHCLQSEKSILS